ncbi:hypothetical protein T7987_15895 [Sulfitobacter faviae]|uniref:Uncharacterized protein n=1 Tax=Sulfitobacter faviae TaxID=1775881 RepID=A0ABZ0V2L6_9RHOB|nr:hypothetical protein [Sulfitobacter faviae]WPZ21625.1 hypothetical protein T7987_15895 [Sulfitobacter faviae]
MTNHITRRSILAAAPAIAAFTPAAASMIPDQVPGGCANLRTPHDPIPGWFEEWKAIRAEVNKLDDGDDTLEAVMHELEHKICTTEPVSRAGAIAQLEYALDDFGEYMMGNIWKDLDTKLFANLLGALKSGVA